MGKDSDCHFSPALPSWRCHPHSRKSLARVSRDAHEVSGRVRHSSEDHPVLQGSGSIMPPRFILYPGLSAASHSKINGVPQPESTEVELWGHRFALCMIWLSFERWKCLAHDYENFKATKQGFHSPYWTAVVSGKGNPHPSHGLKKQPDKQTHSPWFVERGGFCWLCETEVAFITRTRSSWPSALSGETVTYTSSTFSSQCVNWPCLVRTKL